MGFSGTAPSVGYQTPAAMGIFFLSNRGAACDRKNPGKYEQKYERQ
jgi:hypothetical protein